MYTKIDIDENGQQTLVEMNEYQFRCERLGMPEGTPEDVVNAAWAARSTQLAADQNAQSIADQVLMGAIARLSTYNPQLVLDLLPKIKDSETQQALAHINSLLSDMRLLVAALVR